MKKTSPPNTYRAAFNDYTEPHIYMITLTTEYRKPILGQLFHDENNPHIILTPLGMFVNDELDGFGMTLNMITGEKYEGEFKNGIREGKGKLIMSNEDRFEGNFIHGKLEGQGKFIKKNGESRTMLATRDINICSMKYGFITNGMLFLFGTTLYDDVTSFNQS